MVKSKKSAKSTATKQLEISEEEQWRLINQTGILKEANLQPAEQQDEDVPFAEELFNAAIVVIPFCFLLLMMEILIHFQYGKQPTFRGLMDRMIPSVPFLSLFIFCTSRYKSDRRMQFFLFSLATVVGPRMIWLINRGSWLVNMRYCPPLATIWVYTIVQLDLAAAVANLVVVGIWIWWKGMTILK